MYCTWYLLVNITQNTFYEYMRKTACGRTDAQILPRRSVVARTQLYLSPYTLWRTTHQHWVGWVCNTVYTLGWVCLSIPSTNAHKLTIRSYKHPAARVLHENDLVRAILLRL